MSRNISNTPYQTVEFVKVLAQARQQKGLTQKALAARLGIPQSHISNIERGKTDLRLSSLIDFARELDLEVVLVHKKYVPAIRSITVSHPSGSLPTEDHNYLYRLGTAAPVEGG